ncbi:hypothetical protein GCM10007894_23860 [Paraferrimonas haliotis]|uniref:Uncharacterized protein n=1 Tax=Paraferrimonas haliotis TaxID=2013866 RepID=A0AA37WYF7_9GAMM|nr:hypothetical protein GCM10007894_23860 [Paraferrimonas haliotis]
MVLKTTDAIRQSFIWHGLQIIVFATLLANNEAFPNSARYLFLIVIIGLVVHFYRKLKRFEKPIN